MSAMPSADHDVLDAGSLPALLAARARAASDRRLAIDAGAGLLIAVVIAIFRPPLAMPLAAFALSVAMFGTWGILDREAREREGTGRASRSLRVARALSAFVGTTSGILFGLTFFFATLGLWKS